MLVAETVPRETVLGFGYKEGEGGSVLSSPGRKTTDGGEEAVRVRARRKKKPRGFDGRPTATGSSINKPIHGCRLQR